MLSQNEILLIYFGIACAFALVLAVVIVGVYLIISYRRQYKKYKKEYDDLIKKE